MAKKDVIQLNYKQKLEQKKKKHGDWRTSCDSVAKRDQLNIEIISL